MLPEAACLIQKSVKMMGGWEKEEEEAEVNNAALPYVKVMTDDQLETLRKQISVYATICEQLVQMHKNLTSHPDLPGVRLGTLYCDPMMTSAGHKITARQRWTPTPLQLQMLERIFEQGNGTPSKQKIKDMTADLSQHGQITETNVYNWFQNRRARSKRKHPNHTAASTATDADADADADADPEPQTTTTSTTNTNSFPQMAFYDALLSDNGEHLSGKMEVGGTYGIYDHHQDYTLS